MSRVVIPCSSDPYRTGNLFTVRMMPGKPPSESYRELLLDARWQCMIACAEYQGVEISRELDERMKGADVVGILTGINEYFGLDAKVAEMVDGAQEHPAVVNGRYMVQDEVHW